MKLRQIVCNETDLTLTKEKRIIEYGEIFDIEDEERAKEILAATYKDKPVAEVVLDSDDELDDNQSNDNQSNEEDSDDKQVKKNKKSNNK